MEKPVEELDENSIEQSENIDLDYSNYIAGIDPYKDEISIITMFLVDRNNRRIEVWKDGKFIENIGSSVEQSNGMVMTYMIKCNTNESKDNS